MENFGNLISRALDALSGIAAEAGPIIPTLLSGAFVGAVLTYVVALRQLKLKRYMDATNSFIEVTGHAHGYPRGDRAHVGIAEQVAAIWLIVELANEFRFLREPGRRALDRLHKSFSNQEDAEHKPSWSIIAGNAEEALTALKPARAQFKERLTRGAQFSRA